MYNVYLAAPFFSEKQINKIIRLEEELDSISVIKNVFSPRLNQGKHESKNACMWGQDIYLRDIKEIKKADILVAIIDYDGKDCDSGTAFEIGIARLLGKKIIFIQEDNVHVNLMLAWSCDVFLKKIEELRELSFDKMDFTSKPFMGKII